MIVNHIHTLDIGNRLALAIALGLVLAGFRIVVASLPKP